MARYLRPRLFLLSLVLLPASLLCAQQPVIPDSVRTVAIHASKKNFISEYPIDTLVAHLNRFRRDSSLRFFVNTMDDTRTGYYADHVVDIDIDLREPQMGPPRYETVVVQRPSVRPARNSSGIVENVPVYVPSTEQRFIDGKLQPGRANVRLRIIDRKENQKMRKDGFVVQRVNLFDLKAETLLQLLHYLLNTYERP